MVCGLQIEFQIGAEVSKFFNILLQFTLLAGVELGIVRHRDLVKQCLDQIAVFLLKRQSKQSRVSFHQLRGHDHIIIICVVRVAPHLKLIAVCPELRLLEGLVEAAHLFLNLVDAGFQLGQKIILELFHCTFSCGLDLFAVPGQFAFL